MLIHLQGFSTAPNSPSVNSRSGSLGPSLSLGNISGMAANPEVKKRRAPPPPVVTPALQNAETSGQDKAAAQVTVTPQGGLLRPLCRLPSVPSWELEPFTDILVSHQLQLTKPLGLTKWNYQKSWSFVHIHWPFLRLLQAFSHVSLSKSEKFCEALC